MSGVELFGYELKRQKEFDPVSFAPETKDDGAITVAGGAYGTYFDLDGTVRTEAELVQKYRELTQNSEIDTAAEEITNEAIVNEENQKTVSIVLDGINMPQKVKDVLEAEFEGILDLLDFGSNAYEIFRRWYIDGRMYYHAIIDEKAPERGVLECRYIDPRKIRKVRETKRQRSTQLKDAVVQKTMNEYYIYSDRGFNTDKNAPSGGGAVPYAGTTTGIRIAKDAVVHVTSGLLDARGNLVLSYLHKAIKPMNQLRALEDATLIYRISRAPERRIFYIDIGDLPKMKAEQYLRDMMIKHKNRLVYDAQSGEIRDDRKFTTMLEDYWLPRRNGTKGTEIITLPGGQNLGEIEDVRYFQKKLLRSLNVPISRLDDDQAVFNSGKPGEITRDEVKFARFIDRLRMRFSMLFTEILKKQVVLKMIMSLEEFESIQQKIKYKYAKDNYFSELKEAEIWTNRFNLLMMIDPNTEGWIGKYFSNLWVRKNIIQQTDDNIQQIDIQIQNEMDDPQYAPPEPMPTEPGEGANSAEDSGTDWEPGQGNIPKLRSQKKDPNEQARKEAAALGLTYSGFGRYSDKSGHVTHVVEKGVLVKKRAKG